MSEIKICRKCGNPILEDSYYENSNTYHQNYFHERCLTESGFTREDVYSCFLVKNKLCYQIRGYNDKELAAIALELFSLPDKTKELIYSVFEKERKNKSEGY